MPFRDDYIWHIICSIYLNGRSQVLRLTPPLGTVRSYRSGPECRRWQNVADKNKGLHECKAGGVLKKKQSKVKTQTNPTQCLGNDCNVKSVVFPFLLLETAPPCVSVGCRMCAVFFGSMTCKREWVIFTVWTGCTVEKKKTELLQENLHSRTEQRGTNISCHVN